MKVETEMNQTQCLSLIIPMPVIKKYRYWTKSDWFDSQVVHLQKVVTSYDLEHNTLPHCASVFSYTKQDNNNSTYFIELM